MFKKDKKVDEMNRQVVIEEAVCNCCVAATDSLELTECKINEETTITVGALTCQGKELKVSVNFTNVCRNYKLAVSVFIGFLQEDDVVLDPMDVYAYKVCIVDAAEDPEEGCVPLTVEGFCFDLDTDICSDGFIPIKVVAHYVFTPGEFQI